MPGVPVGRSYLRPSAARYAEARERLTHLISDASTLASRPAAEIAAHVTARVLPRRLPADTPLAAVHDVLNLAALVGALVAFQTAKDWCACGCTTPVDQGELPLVVYRRHQATGRDRTLAAIMLTSQVVPALLSPELLLLAVEDVVCRWRRYLDRWDEATPAADRPAGSPMRLVEFVDRYCVQVEHGAGPDGCTGRCPPSRAGRGCDPDVCAAGAWWAHVTALAGRAGPSHPAHRVLAGVMDRIEAS